SASGAGLPQPARVPSRRTSTCGLTGGEHYAASDSLREAEAAPVLAFPGRRPAPSSDGRSVRRCRAGPPPRRCPLAGGCARSAPDPGRLFTRAGAISKKRVKTNKVERTRERELNFPSPLWSE